MRRIAFSLGMAAALIASCSIQEEDFKTSQQDDVIYFASFEQPAEEETRVYANENLLLRWTADDRVSIFGKNTYNQQYKFFGETGDNSGGFNKVNGAEYVTGNPISHTVSVYPYREDTKISEDEVITLTLPSVQHYAENTFGLGANTMVSVSEDNVLQYKNAGGYLMLNLYGDGISISAVKLRGNNNERIAGSASITVSSDGTPLVTMGSDATTEITLKCEPSAVLGATADKSTAFWYVLPPVTFSKGFTIVVKRKDGTAFTKSTSKALTISRNHLSKMSPFEVEMEGTQPNNVIYYTSSNSAVVTPYNNGQSVFGAVLFSNNYVDDMGVIRFGDAVTSIGYNAFYSRSSLVSISLPETVRSIGNYAFRGCTNLSFVNIPENVTSIGLHAFSECSNLSSVLIPENLTTIERWAFNKCSSLTSIDIPVNVTDIGESAFYGCSSLTSAVIPENVTHIGNYAFGGCPGLTLVTLKARIPPTLDSSPFSGYSGPICVPADCVEAYKSNASWRNYANQIVGEGTSYIYYTSSDGGVVNPASSSSIHPLIVSNVYSGGQGVITLAGVIDSFGTGTFNGCSTLTSIQIPEGVTNIGISTFNGCTSLTSVSLPESLSSIEDSAFKDCSNLSSIHIPKGVNGIGGLSFCGCTSLTSITIPKNVLFVGNSAFKGCSALQRIDVKPTVPPTGGSDMFTDTGYCPIYIPAGSDELYANADFWKRYILRMRVDGQDHSIAYTSTDYSQDGEVMLLQQATVGRGINIIFLGDGFLDKDMEPGGKYERKMKEAMEQFFAFEPYYSFRSRFNIYAVKVVSANDIYGDDGSNRRLTYEEDDIYYYRTELSMTYGSLVPNPYNQTLKICTICNTDSYLARSFCTWMNTGRTSSIVYDAIDVTLNHELGGHGFALLQDEYEEFPGVFADTADLDSQYSQYGRGYNVDWRSDPETVRWAHLLKDSRYSYEGLGVFEGGGRYSYGVYRPSETSMMRQSGMPFNAPSRERIYKTIMGLSEGSGWTYDYEEFVRADERGRMEAAEYLGPWRSPQRKAKMQSEEDLHYPPVMVDDAVKAVGMDKEGRVILVRK